MDLGSIFLLLALALLVGLIITRPFAEKHSVNVSQREQAVSHLLAERDRLLEALQELDFDYHLQKIPLDEYPAQRARLVSRGVEILKKLDEMTGQPAEETDSVEAAILARRLRRAGDLALGGPSLTPEAASAPGKPAAPGDDPVEALIAARRRGRTEKSTGFCPNCGRPFQKSDKFCSSCGALL